MKIIGDTRLTGRERWQAAEGDGFLFTKDAEWERVAGKQDTHTRHAIAKKLRDVFYRNRYAMIESLDALIKELEA